MYAQASSVRPANSGPLSTTIALRQPDRAVQAIEDPRDAESGQRAVDFDGDALAGEVVHDVQRAEAAAIGQRVAR
jgi:hypothetical protein